MKRAALFLLTVCLLSMNSSAEAVRNKSQDNELRNRVLGWIEEAARLAESNKEPEDPERPILIRAEYLPYIDPYRALFFAQEIEDPSDKASALAGVAAAFSKTDWKQAHRLLEQALSIVESIGDPNKRAHAAYTLMNEAARVDTDICFRAAGVYISYLNSPAKEPYDTYNNLQYAAQEMAKRDVTSAVKLAEMPPDSKARDALLYT
ncbi:MAG: hypothetical protein ACREJQ_04675, partial [bacterium]